jgi:hypothetical protein
MTNRTLQFLGAAYGTDSVTITATIDNVIVFDGVVTTLDATMPEPDHVTKPMPVLFAVENSSQFPIDFAGSKPMSIAVSGGNCIILDEVLSNYTDGFVTIERIINGNVSNFTRTTAGNATNFVSCYRGTPPNSEGTPDCRSSVVINDKVQVPEIVPKAKACWTWVVNTGNTITYNLNVGIGNIG